MGTFLCLNLSPAAAGTQAVDPNQTFQLSVWHPTPAIPSLVLFAEVKYQQAIPTPCLHLSPVALGVVCMTHLVPVNKRSNNKC